MTEQNIPAEDRYGKDVKHSICPLNLFFEGDEDKIDQTKCTYGVEEVRGCSMECKKKPEPKLLTQYLDEYIKHEVEDGTISPDVAKLYAYDSWCELLEQALDAYQSTEGVQIKIEKC